MPPIFSDLIAIKLHGKIPCGYIEFEVSENRRPEITYVIYVNGSRQYDGNDTLDENSNHSKLPFRKEIKVDYDKLGIASQGDYTIMVLVYDEDGNEAFSILDAKIFEKKCLGMGCTSEGSNRSRPWRCIFVSKQWSK